MSPAVAAWSFSLTRSLTLTNSELTRVSSSAELLPDTVFMLWKTP